MRKSSPKHQHVFLAPIAVNVVSRRNCPAEEIVFHGEDRERAKNQEVPDSGWIQLSSDDTSARQDEPATGPPFARTRSGKVIGTLSTSGYDDKGVAVRVTGFLSQHRADIAVGYGTTMKEFQGATFVFAVDREEYEQMAKELPKFEENMNRDYEAREHAPQEEPVRRYDITIIVKKNQPGEFCKATGIIAKWNVNIRSMMGGPYTPKSTKKDKTPPRNFGAITLQIDVPVAEADRTIAAIWEEMEAQPDWFVSVRNEHGTPPQRASGETRIDDTPGGAVTGQPTRHSGP